MLTLFHSPRSRSTRVVALVKELGALDAVGIEVVSIRRLDGTGARDPRNPHPEGKVPALRDGRTLVRESSAIMLHLADLFPDAGMSVPPGHPQRGEYLSWFAWYSGVLEPVMAIGAAGIDHPVLRYTFGDGAEMKARLAEALADRPFLMGERFTAADLLLHSPYAFFGKPGEPVLDAWVDRCMERPGAAFAAEFDTTHAPA